MPGLQFPEIPKISVSKEFQTYLSAPKSRKIDTAFNYFLKFTRSESYKTTRYIGKVTSLAFRVKKNMASLENLKAAQKASQIASTVTGALSLFSSIGSGISLIKMIKMKNVKKEERLIRKLKITKYSINIINSITSFLGILDRFHIIELAKITKAMGKIPLIGQGLVRIFPTSVVFSILSLISQPISIVISTLKMNKIKKRLKAAEAKKKMWKGTIDKNFVERKIDRLASRLKEGIRKAKKLKTHIERMKPSLQALRQISFKTAKGKYKKGIKQYKEALNEMRMLKQAHHLRTENREKWQAIFERLESGSILESDKEALEKIKQAKVIKWELKKLHGRVAMVKIGFKIAFSVLSIALSIVSIALTIIFPASIPVSATIALSLIGINVSTASLIKTFYFNRIKKCQPINLFGPRKKYS